MWTDRTEILIGKDGLQMLANSKVAVIGVGGVGGAATVMLARAGIGNLMIMDFDDVEESNINRQFVADTQTIGKPKVEVMREIISKINPNCKVKSINERLTKDNVELLKDIDFVVDAIDSVPDKVELICHCKENKIKIVSAMGAGNRISLPNYVVTDIFKTSNDGLAKCMRKRLREREVSSLDVVTAFDPPIKNAEQSKVGSISYHPTVAGCVIASFVVQKLLQNV